MSKELTTKEALEFLCISKTGFYYHIRRGNIKAVDSRPGPNGPPTCYYSMEDLEKLKTRVNRTNTYIPEDRHLIEQTEEYLTPREAAKFMDMSVSTIKTYISLGVIVPAGRKNGVRGNPSLIHVDRLKELKEDKRIFPDQDEYCDNGCVIYWSRLENGNGQARVWLKCADCGKEFLKYAHHLKSARKLGEFTGCCGNCYSRHRKPGPMPSKGKIRKDGYIFRHWKTFSEKEYEFLKPMFNGLYIPEHRAVMALYLGRILDSGESVHHINGDKCCNKIGNLEIFDKSRHSKLHTEMVRRETSLLKKIKKLEKQVKVLEKLLIQNSIPVPVID